MDDEKIKKQVAENLTRRTFFTKVGVAGAVVGSNLILGKNSHAFETPLIEVNKRINNGDNKAWPSKFDPSTAVPRYYPRSKPKSGEKIHEFDIDLTITVHEIVPGVKIHAFTYNKTLPGPEIRVPEGDWVLVNFKNKTSEFHTIHWHGIQLANDMDGVPMGTQWPVGPGQTFRYLFRAQPAGTHFYHCHNMTPLHVQAGMFGALIIEPKKDFVREVFPYERDYTLCLSEVDTNMVEMQMNEMMTMMGTMESMSQSQKLMKEMNGRMMGWFFNKKSFLDAVKNGYIPPYAKSMSGAYPPTSIQLLYD